jgi:hypothetical protein
MGSGCHPVSNEQLFYLDRSEHLYSGEVRTITKPVSTNPPSNTNLNTNPILMLGDRDPDDGKYNFEIKSKLYHHLINLDRDTLAKQIASIQSELGYPGLITECEGLVDKLKLPDIRTTSLSKLQWKKIVKKSIVEKN